VSRRVSPGLFEEPGLAARGFSLTARAYPVTAEAGGPSSPNLPGQTVTTALDVATTRAAAALISGRRRSPFESRD